MSFRKKCREIIVIQGKVQGNLCHEIRVIGKSVGKPVSSAGKSVSFRKGCREISVICREIKVIG